MAFILCPAAAVGADDWPQFRRDPQRTGASRDHVNPPLTELWDEPGGTPPIIWRGRVFLVRTGGIHRSLHCLDARTGKTLWRKSLALAQGPAHGDSQSDPVITESGVLFVFDLERNQPVIRALNPFTGQQVGGAAYGEKYEIGVRHPGHLRIGSGRTGAAPLGDFGFPLLVGDELVASSLGSQLARWSLGGPLQLLSLLHASRTTEERPFAAKLYRCVPALAPTGVVVTGTWPFAIFSPRDHMDGTNFIAVLNGAGEVSWHHEMPEMPGMPVVGPGTIFVPTVSGLVALDQNGNTRWSQNIAGQIMNPARSIVGYNRRLVRQQYVVTQGRIFNGHCSARDQGTGEIIWKHSGLSLGGTVAATPKYLVVLGGGRVSMVRLADGKIVWRTEGPLERGNLDDEVALSGGLVFLGGLKTLRTLTSAERTFHVAVDSPNLAHYRLHPPAEETNPEADVPAGPETPTAPPEPSPRPKGERPGSEAESAAPEQEAGASVERKPGAKPGKQEVADSTILRLRWQGPPDELVRRARDRRFQILGIPMTLVLDWLDPTRAKPVGLPPEGWTAAQIDRYASVCGELAEACRPNYFDVAPEINVYLLRRPEQFERVRALLKAVRACVARVSPETKVCTSFNAEALSGYYGRGSFEPFGTLPMPERRGRTTTKVLQEIQAMQVAVAELVTEVDAMGLTSCPQAGFIHYRQMPADYLLALKPIAKGKPIVVTSLQMRHVAGELPPPIEQFQFLRRAIQFCYWLDARVVAYPAAMRAEGESAESTAALVEKPATPAPGRQAKAPANGDDPARPASEPTPNARPALGLWRELLAWRQVERLSATIHDPTRPFAPNLE